MIQVWLRPGTQKAVASGHPWVYRNQIDPEAGDLASMPSTEPGSLVTVHDSRGRYLGSGFYNPRSMITVRLLTHRREMPDDSLIVRRIEEALAFREANRRPDTDSYRLVFAEADRLPGLIVDQYGDTVVLQVLALGMERWQETAAACLVAKLRPARLILKNDDPIRLKEGLELYQRAYYGDLTRQVTIRENGLLMKADLDQGQKTGYFLDQKANHVRLRRFCAGRRVLDAFCYSGGFALNAAAAGAAAVTAVDISPEAVTLARLNAELNGLSEKITFASANAFDFLREAVAERQSFDTIVLDPPAFAKSHGARDGARRGYKEINLSAFRLLGPGGILATHSCSYHMPEPMFIETVMEAAWDARRTVRLLAVHRQDFDHPVLGGYPESHYLKSLWLEVIA